MNLAGTPQVFIAFICGFPFARKWLLASPGHAVVFLHDLTYRPWWVGHFMAWLRWVVASLLPSRPLLNRRPHDVEFVVENVALGWVFLEVLQLSPVTIVPLGYAVAQFVEALRYNPKGRRFDSQWCTSVVYFSGVLQLSRHYHPFGVRGGAVRRGTALQARRSQVWFPVVSLEFFIDIILPPALWPWGWLNL